MNQEHGELTLNYRGKQVTIKYHYWSMSGAAHVNIYDKDGKEYRFARMGSVWRSIRDGNNWPLEFRKVLGAELERLHARLSR